MSLYSNVQEQYEYDTISTMKHQRVFSMDGGAEPSTDPSPHASSTASQPVLKTQVTYQDVHYWYAILSIS
jgi:hypothetical protein